MGSRRQPICGYDVPPCQIQSCRLTTHISASGGLRCQALAVGARPLNACVRQMPHARFVLIPVSDATRGHGTHIEAAVWKQDLIDFLHQTEPRDASVVSRGAP